MKKIFSVLFYALVSLVIFFCVWILGSFFSMMLLGAVCWVIGRPTDFITNDFISGFLGSWVFSSMVVSCIETNLFYKKEQKKNKRTIIENVRRAQEVGEVATLQDGTCSHCGRTGLKSGYNFCDRCSYTFVTVAEVEQKLGIA